jgi:hypothetical protein
VAGFFLIVLVIVVVLGPPGGESNRGRRRDEHENEAAGLFLIVLVVVVVLGLLVRKAIEDERLSMGWKGSSNLKQLARLNPMLTVHSRSSHLNCPPGQLAPRAQAIR